MNKMMDWIQSLQHLCHCQDFSWNHVEYPHIYEFQETIPQIPCNLHFHRMMFNVMQTKQHCLTSETATYKGSLTNFYKRRQ